MSNHFGKTNDALNHLCYNPYLSGGVVVNNTLATIRYSKNAGQLTYLGFCQDGSDSFNGVYSGGTHFKIAAIILLNLLLVILLLIQLSMSSVLFQRWLH